MLLVSWTILSIACSFPILAMVLGAAAWGGVNIALGIYLFLATGGIVGLLAGFFAAFSRKVLFAWVTCASAIAVAGLSAIFAGAFLFDRDGSVPLNDPISFGSVHAPILVFYSLALVCSCVEALLYFPKARKMQAL